MVISDRAPALPDQELMKDHSTDKINNGSKPTRDEKRFAKNRGKPIMAYTDKQDWRKAQHLLLVDMVTNEFMMTRQQKKQIREIIGQYGIKTFHRRLNDEAVIVGLCMCLLRSKGRLINFKGKFVRKTGLTKTHYKHIERKTKDLGLF